MATVPGALFVDTVSGIQVLFNVDFSKQTLTNADLTNQIDIQNALDNLVGVGALTQQSLTAGLTQYNNLSGQKILFPGEPPTPANFIFADPSYRGGNVNVGPSGSAIIDTFKPGTVRGGGESNTILVADNQPRTVNTNAGDDVVALTGVARTTVNTGSGNDSVYVAVAPSVRNNITTGGGNDKVDLINGESRNAISTGGGDDRIIIEADKTGRDVVNDFSRRDVLQINDRNGDGKVTVGDGGDVVSIVQAGANTRITLINGETIILKNVKAKQLVQDGDGTFHLG